MAFTEAGREAEKEKFDGLPMAWENLDAKCCPRCGEPLTLFEHLMLWKCTCGFKISHSKFNEITYKLRDGDFYGDNSGYRYGRYYDEPPF